MVNVMEVSNQSPSVKGQYGKRKVVGEKKCRAIEKKRNINLSSPNKRQMIRILSEDITLNYKKYVEADTLLDVPSAPYIGLSDTIHEYPSEVSFPEWEINSFGTMIGIFKASL
jgi:hypothetical protein